MSQKSGIQDTAPPHTAAVFFDVTGTLLGLKRSVGSVYLEFIQRCGLAETGDACWEERLDKAFAKSLQGAEPLAFPGVSRVDLPNLERQWWRRRLRQSLDAVGLADSIRFEQFFEAVLAYYSQPEVWHLMKGCRQALSRLAARGVRLAVVSNFDSRLPNLLESLGIADFFETVVYSSRAGAAKPDALIFDLALQETGLPPNAVVHVGDSIAHDVRGAEAAGLRALLFDPQGRHSNQDENQRIERLTDIPGLLL